MPHSIHIHDAQTTILASLLFCTQARYAELLKKTSLESDHFKFHLAKLVELGYVTKNSTGAYSLTASGKEHANKLDTDTNTIERQPKLSVLIVGWRQRESTDTVEFLVQQRLKNPYYGFWGRIGGKIRWGETAAQAAARELKEETGLSAELTFHNLYHKMDYSEETGDILEDKFFVTFIAKNFKGTLKETFEGGRNCWLTQDEINQQDKVFAGLGESELYVKKAIPSFVETVHHYSSKEY